MARLGKILEYRTVKVLIIVGLIYGILNNALYFSSFFFNKEERQRRVALAQDMDTRLQDLQKTETDLTARHQDLVNAKAALDQLNNQIKEMENAGVKKFPEYKTTVDQYNEKVKSYDPSLKVYQQNYGDYLNKIEEFNQEVAEYNEISLLVQKRYTIPTYLQEKVSPGKWFANLNVQNIPWNPLQWGIWEQISQWIQSKIQIIKQGANL